MEQVSPSQWPNTVNFFAEGSILFDPALVQPLPPNTSTTTGTRRTNVVQKLFFLSQYNQGWTGTGYQVLPSVPGSACVGSLYRFTTNSRANVALMASAFRSAPVSNLNLVADGIVHFRALTFATNGFRLFPNFPFQTNAFFLDAQTAGATLVNSSFANWNASLPDQVDCYFLSNAVPAYVELELGILEPQVLERFKSIGNPTAQRTYLEQHVAQVHIFRQRIAIRNVDLSAYVFP
jgi:hypothetical protein